MMFEWQSILFNLLQTWCFWGYISRAISKKDIKFISKYRICSYKINWILTTSHFNVVQRANDTGGCCFVLKHHFKQPDWCRSYSNRFRSIWIFAATDSCLVEWALAAFKYYFYNTCITQTWIHFDWTISPVLYSVKYSVQF